MLLSKNEQFLPLPVTAGLEGPPRNNHSYLAISFSLYQKKKTLKLGEPRNVVASDPGDSRTKNAPSCIML